MATLDTQPIKPYFDQPAVMPRVAAEHGRTMGGQLRDILRYCVGGNKLAAEEYYNLRLFDGAIERAEKKRFVGVFKSTQIWDAMMAVNPWLDTIRDKVACELMLREHGVAGPRTLAVTGRDYPEDHPTRLDTPETFAMFLRGAKYPIFAKPLLELRSVGTARLEGVEGDAVRLSDGRTMTFDALWSEIHDHFDGKFVFQECLAPHAEMAPLSPGGLPTLRVLTLDAGDGPAVHRVVAKLSAGGNVADNFWREGNMLAAVDSETGVMDAAVTAYGLDRERRAAHPETGAAIEGARYPMFDEAIALALKAARAMPGSVIMGFDVAITANGPIVLEINESPDLMMLQIASDRGVLDERMRAALAHAEAQAKAGAKEAAKAA